GVDNLVFKRLNPLESGSLTKPFSMAEVKAAVWDCNSYKTPVPTGSISASLRISRPSFRATSCALSRSFIGMAS
ncbi:cysteine-rich receptor-like protein kinase, partial [Trifolium medium]|nr:cysteine-rich receptor-like protein kinase [Trifolium medium]